MNRGFGDMKHTATAFRLSPWTYAAAPRSDRCFRTPKSHTAIISILTGRQVSKYNNLHLAMGNYEKANRGRKVLDYILAGIPEGRRRMRPDCVPDFNQALRFGNMGLQQLTGY